MHSGFENRRMREKSLFYGIIPQGDSDERSSPGHQTLVEEAQSFDALETEEQIPRLKRGEWADPTAQSVVRGDHGES